MEGKPLPLNPSKKRKIVLQDFTQLFLKTHKVQQRQTALLKKTVSTFLQIADKLHNEIIKLQYENLRLKKQLQER